MAASSASSPYLSDPRVAEVIALLQAGRRDEAKARCLAILNETPDHLPSLELLGHAAQNDRQYPQMAEWMRKAIACAPNKALLYHKLGIALLEQGQVVEALAQHEKALALEPQNDVFQMHRDLAAKVADAQAEAAFRRTLQADPQDVEALLGWGTMLNRQRRHREALLLLHAARALRPERIDIHYQEGSAYLELAQPLAALASFTRVMMLKPDTAAAYTARASAWREIRAFDEAIADLDRAIERFPERPAAYLHKGIELLRLGELARGWPLYERRPALPLAFAQPRWRGDLPLAGKTILLYGEQGFGDNIQFCRYTALLAEHGARVILAVPPPLLALFGTLAGVAQLTSDLGQVAGFDYHCPLMSLPLAFATTLASIPSPAHYLAADPAKSAFWQQRLGPKRRPRVGLVWSGNLQYGNDHRRSLPLSDLLAALPAGYDYISLQNRLRPEDQGVLAASPIRHFGAELGDFSATAALCDQLDLVISVDTSVAHLAGALGKPVWILLPYLADWRWLLDRSDSPWYPSATLFRQDKRRSWQTVIDAVAASLQTLDHPAP